MAKYTHIVLVRRGSNTLAERGGGAKYEFPESSFEVSVTREEYGGERTPHPLPLLTTAGDADLER